MIKYLSKDDNFKDLIKSGNLLVDFYAEWCGPCKMLGPVLETVNEVEILKVNIDEFGDIANKYGIMSVPTLIYFKDGNIVSKEIGFRNKEEIVKMLSE